ncbi:hypothetical protein ACFL2M_01070 [Patescibacteria group bacterium]
MKKNTFSIIFTITAVFCFFTAINSVNAGPLPVPAEAGVAADEMVAIPPECEDPIYAKKEIREEVQTQLDGLGYESWGFTLQNDECSFEGYQSFTLFLEPTFSFTTQATYKYEVYGSLPGFDLEAELADFSDAEAKSVLLQAEADTRVQAFLQYFPETEGELYIYGMDRIYYQYTETDNSKADYNSYQISINMDPAYDVAPYVESYSIPPALATVDFFPEVEQVGLAEIDVDELYPNCGYVFDGFDSNVVYMSASPGYDIGDEGSAYWRVYSYPGGDYYDDSYSNFGCPDFIEVYIPYDGGDYFIQEEIGDSDYWSGSNWSRSSGLVKFTMVFGVIVMVGFAVWAFVIMVKKE